MGSRTNQRELDLAEEVRDLEATTATFGHARMGQACLPRP